MESWVESLSEIAGVWRTKSLVARDHETELLGALKVIKGMRERGVQAAEHRKTPLQRAAEERMAAGDAVTPLPGGLKVREWQGELADLERRYRGGAFTKFKQPDLSATAEPSIETKKLHRGPAITHAGYTPEFLRMTYLARCQKQEQRLNAEVLRLIESGEWREKTDAPTKLSDEVDAESENQAEGEDDMGDSLSEISVDTAGSDLDRVEVDLDSFGLPGKQTHGKVKRGSSNASLASIRRRVRLYLDDRKAITDEPPLLFWDRRVDEPLLVHQDEFSTSKATMCLLDLRPKSLQHDMYQRDDALRDTMRFFLKRLFVAGTRSVAEAIQVLGPGALDALVPLVPSLTNPAQGGNPDLTEFRVRMLRYHMIVDLLDAWRKWPWRRTPTEIVQARLDIS